jgi:hypothetical protein
MASQCLIPSVSRTLSSDLFRITKRFGNERIIIHARWCMHSTNQPTNPLTHCCLLLSCVVQVIVPQLKDKKRVLISAHGNSLRALVKYLDNVSDSDIVELNIPTGIPIVYELDEQLKPIKHYFLADEEKVKAAQAAVAAQGKAK